MIRINLLRKERKKEKRPRMAAREPSETTKQLGFVAIFVVMVAVIAYLWFDISGQKDHYQKQLAEATRKLNRLIKVERVKERAEQLEREKENLSLHLQALNELKDNQRSPLFPLAHVFYALQIHTDVSFTEIREQASETGSSYLIRGEASENSLRRFMQTLEQYKITKRLDFPRVDKVKLTFELPVNFISQQELKKEFDKPEQAES